MKFEKESEALVHENFLRLQILERIFEIMNEKKITQTKLAKKMKLSKSQISRLLSDDRNLTLSSIAKIFYALGEELEVLTKSQVEHLKSDQSSPNNVIHLVVKDYSQMPSTFNWKPNLLQNFGNIKMPILRPPERLIK